MLLDYIGLFFGHHLLTYFLLVLGWNLGPYGCWAATLPLDPCPQPFFALIIFQIGSCVFVQDCLRPWSSYLCFLCSRDHRHVPLCLLACFLRWKSHWLFFSGRSQALLLFSSWVVGIRHELLVHTWLKIFFKIRNYNKKENKRLGI
jgi:hypothetical protein